MYFERFTDTFYNVLNWWENCQYGAPGLIQMQRYWCTSLTGRPHKERIRATVAFWGLGFFVLRFFLMMEKLIWVFSFHLFPNERGKTR